jgi:hypothetical protein
MSIKQIPSPNYSRGRSGYQPEALVGQSLRKKQYRMKNPMKKEIQKENNKWLQTTLLLGIAFGRKYERCVMRGQTFPMMVLELQKLALCR